MRPNWIMIWMPSRSGACIFFLKIWLNRKSKLGSVVICIHFALLGTYTRRRYYKLFGILKYRILARRLYICTYYTLKYYSSMYTSSYVRAAPAARTAGPCTALDREQQQLCVHLHVRCLLHCIEETVAAVRSPALAVAALSSVH